MRVKAGLVLLATLVGLAGCLMPGSGEAFVTSVTIGSFTIDAAIDSTANSVVITAPPIDLGEFIPQFTVSEGATIGTLPQFVDGQPALFTVTSESGEEATWEVTINLRRGITFQYDGSWVVLLEGVTHGGDPTANLDSGSGEPNGSVMYYQDVYVTVLETEQDINVDSGEPAHYAELRTEESVAVGENITYDFNYNYDSDGDDVYEVRFYAGAGNLTLEELGVNPGDIIRGSFTGGTGTNDVDMSNRLVESGYFKVIRIVDQNYFPWAG